MIRKLFPRLFWFINLLCWSPDTETGKRISPRTAWKLAKVLK